MQFQSAHVLGDRLIVLAHPNRSLSQVVDAVYDVAGHFRFFAQLQRLLVVGAGVFVLPFFKIDAPMLFRQMACKLSLPTSR